MWSEKPCKIRAFLVLVSDPVYISIVKSEFFDGTFSGRYHQLDLGYHQDEIQADAKTDTPSLRCSSEQSQTY